MEKFKFDLDTKSFFYGISNDTAGGHTATVSTNLKQGPTTKKELDFFLSLKNEIDLNRNDSLIDSCSRKSKSIVKIIKCLYFNDIYVNGTKLKCDAEFSAYIKKEINPEAIQFGRIKLHYPISFKYCDDYHDIDNKKVIEEIRKSIGGYAFIVNSMTIYFDSTRIDFDVSIIGDFGIPYSKVFIDKKGLGNKFNKLFIEEFDSYDYEIVAIRRYLGRNIASENYATLFSEFERKSIDIVLSSLKHDDDFPINVIKNKYPYSPVDIEYYLNGKKKYLILKTTATNIDYFFISNQEWRLLSVCRERCNVCLVKKICSEMPIQEMFDYNKVCDMNKECMSFRVYK